MRSVVRIVAALMAAAVLGFGIHLLLRHGTGTDVGTGAGPGGPGVRTTDTFVSEVSYSDAVSGALVSADGRTISAITPSMGDGVSRDMTDDLDVRVTGQDVVLRVEYRTMRPVQNPAPGIAAPYNVLTAKVAESVAGRRIVDGAGRPIPVFDGRTLLTAPPGSGWTPSDAVPEAVGQPGGADGTLVGAAQSFSSTAQSYGITLVQFLPGAKPPSYLVPTQGDPVTVRGVAGLEVPGRSLVWSERGQTMVLSFQGVPPGGPALLAFADSLR